MARKRALFPLFDGKPVTRTYSRMLWDCRRNGWSGTLTSGKRSWAKQLWLWRGWMARKPGFNPANHPKDSRHCKTGWRCAVDVSEGDELVRVALRRGWPVTRPYAHEPWHVEFFRKPKNTRLKGVLH